MTKSTRGGGGKSGPRPARSSRGRTTPDAGLPRHRHLHQPWATVDANDGVEVDQHQGLSALSSFVPVWDQISRHRPSYSSSSPRIWAISAAISSSVIGL